MRVLAALRVHLRRKLRRDGKVVKLRKSDVTPLQTQTTFYGMDVARADGEIFVFEKSPEGLLSVEWPPISDPDLCRPKFDVTIHGCTGDETCIFCPPPVERKPERYVALSGRSEGAAVSGEMNAISPHMVTVLFGQEDLCVRGEPHQGHCVPLNIILGEE